MSNFADPEENQNESAFFKSKDLELVKNRFWRPSSEASGNSQTSYTRKKEWN